LNPDGALARLKAHLVAKEYFQTYDINHQDALFLVAKMASVWLLISFVTTHHWTLHYLDIKNAFLHGILDKEVYMGNHMSLLLRSMAKCSSTKVTL